MKALKAQLMAAIAMTLVAALTIGSSTYAWFSMNTAVTATGMQIQAKAESGIVIANEAYESWTASANTTTQKHELLPTSTADFTAWYHATSDDANDASAGQDASKYTEVSNDTATYSEIAAGTAISSGTVLYVKSGTTYSPKVITGTVVPKDTTYYQQTLGTNNYYSLSKFYIKSATANALSKTLYIKSVTVSGASASQSLNKALRVGIKLSTSTSTFIFAPVAGATLSYQVKGGTNVTATDASASATTALNTNTGVTSIPATDSGLFANVYVWFEGEDAACTSNNVVATLDNITVSVQFATDDTPSTPVMEVAQKGNDMKATVANAPTGTTVAYQWKESTTVDGTYTAVTDATDETIAESKLTSGNYYKCAATYGSGDDAKTYENETGVKYEKIAVSITNTDNTLSITITPTGKEAAYKWYVSDDGSTSWTETATTATLVYTTGKYYKCDVTVLGGTITTEVYPAPAN